MHSKCCRCQSDTYTILILQESCRRGLCACCCSGGLDNCQSCVHFQPSRHTLCNGSSFSCVQDLTQLLNPSLYVVRIFVYMAGHIQVRDAGHESSHAALLLTAFAHEQVGLRTVL